MEGKNGLEARVKVLEHEVLGQKGLVQKIDDLERRFTQFEIKLTLLQWRTAVLSALFSSAATLIVQFLFSKLVG